MAFVNYYNCKNASGTTLTDSIGTNNGTLAGASLPTINANGYLSFVGGNGATVGDRCRVNLAQANFNYTNQNSFTVIVKFKTNWSSGSTITGYMFVAGYKNAANGRLGTVYQTNVNALQGTMVDTNNKRQQWYVLSMYDPSASNWGIIVMTYSANDGSYYYQNQFRALTTDDTLSPTYNFYAANGLATLGAGLYDSSPNYHYDFTGDIEFFGNRNDRMTIGDIKTYSDYLTGAIQC